MNGRCPKCKQVIKVSGHRGSKVSNVNCPDCKVPLQGVNKGVKKYQCPVTGDIVGFPTSGLQTDRPYRVIYLPDLEQDTWRQDRTIDPSHDPEPDGTRLYPGGRTCRRCCRFVAFESLGLRITAVGTRPCRPGQLRTSFVLAPGTVVAASVARALEGDTQNLGFLPVRLEPVTTEPDGTWVTNTPIVHRRCRGCSVQVLESAPRPASEWTPAQETNWLGRPTRPGPHAAGTPACGGCYPQEA